MREQCLKEMALSMLIGNIITLMIFAALHKVFTPVEVVAFWIGTWMVSTYCVWSVIDWVDNMKRRSA